MGSNRQDADTLQYGRWLLQILLIVLIIGCWSHTLLGPIKLLVVLLHEVSHGLMALATGGTVESIYITPQETGACQTTGGNATLIVGAGYLGSMFFGGLLLTCSRSRSHTAAACCLLALLTLGAAFTVMEDGYSRRFGLAVGAAALLFGMFSPPVLSTVALRCVGTISCLYALVDIYDDTLSGAAVTTATRSDAAVFSELTGIAPESVGLAWLLISVVYFFITLRASMLVVDEPAAPAASAAQPARA